jgi:hypothetical protein
MADSKSLWIVGFILGVITAVVMLVAGVVVHAHIDGSLNLDEAQRQIAATPTLVAGLQ